MKLVLGFGQTFAIDINRYSGGLAMFWSDHVNINFLSYSDGHVDMLCNFNDNSSLCYVTGFYGNLHTSEQHHS